MFERTLTLMTETGKRRLHKQFTLGVFGTVPGGARVGQQSAGPGTEWQNTRSGGRGPPRLRSAEWPQRSHCHQIGGARVGQWSAGRRTEWQNTRPGGRGPPRLRSAEWPQRSHCHHPLAKRQDRVQMPLFTLGVTYFLAMLAVFPGRKGFNRISFNRTQDWRI